MRGREDQGDRQEGGRQEDLHQEGHAQGRPLGPCLDEVEDKFVEAVAKAEKKTSCSGTASALEALADACLGVLPPAAPCSGGDGYPTCDGTCAAGLACHPAAIT